MSELAEGTPVPGAVAASDAVRGIAGTGPVHADPRLGEVAMSIDGVLRLYFGESNLPTPGFIVDAAGDEAVVLSPAWPNSTSIIALSHGVPVDVPLRLAGERYEIDFAALEAAVSSRARLVVFTSPSNPLGWVADISEQRQLKANRDFFVAGSVLEPALKRLDRFLRAGSL